MKRVVYRSLIMKRYSLVLLISLSLFNLGKVYGADGSSGCGPGWYILKQNSLVSSFGRAVTNGILGPLMTLGMTFGTSNCSKHSIVQKEKKSLHYVTVALENLRIDAAKGEGQWLNAYRDTFSCKSYQTRFNQSFKENYAEIFATEDPMQIVQESHKVIKSDPVLMNHCYI